MIASLFLALTDYDSVSVFKSMSLNTSCARVATQQHLLLHSGFRPPLIADGVGIPLHAGGLDIVAVAYHFGEGDEGGKTKRNTNRAKKMLGGGSPL